MADIFNKLFSVETQNSRKIIKILGIKFKIFDFKPELCRQAALANKNLLQLVWAQLKNSNEDELFCLKNNCLVFVFNKNCLELDYKFFQDYILPFGYADKPLELIILDKKSILYKEHIERLQKGEFCWKYIDRDYFIGHTFISKDRITGEIYIISANLNNAEMPQDNSKIRHLSLNSKRKYIKGLTVGEYLRNKTFDVQFEIVNKLLENIFDIYRDTQEPNKVSGKLFDCHLYNFLIGEDGLFHFIDFDLECTESLERSYCIYYMLYFYNRELYYKMLKHHNCKDNSDYYQQHFVKAKQQKVAATKTVLEEYANLKRKYFTEAGTEAVYEIPSACLIKI